MGRGSIEMESALHRKRSKCKSEVEDCLVNPKEAEASVAEPECSQGHRTAYLACSEGCPKRVRSLASLSRLRVHIG